MSEESLSLVEKYRPRKFSDIVGNKEIVDELAEKVKAKRLPHILLYGPAGTGKTSLQKVICMELYNGNTSRSCKEFNASDDNGINVVRVPIKDFAQHSNPQEDVDFRICVLEECDEMTPQAQAALRRIMEMFAKHCRFILTCNNIKKVMDPLKSRCQPFEVKPIKPEDMLDRLVYICLQEHIKIDIKAVEYIAEKSNGDMRKALNHYLEPAKVFATKNPDKKLEVAWFESLKEDSANYLPILKSGLNGKFLQTQQSLFNKIKSGEEAKKVIIHTTESAFNYENFPERMKGDIAMVGMKHEMYLNQGGNPASVINSFVGELGLTGEIWKKKREEEE